MVAALFTSDGALPFDLMLVYPQPLKGLQSKSRCEKNARAASRATGFAQQAVRP